MTRTKATRRSRVYKRKRLMQKLIGIGMLGISAIVIIMAMYGKTPEDSDVTPVLIFIPIGLSLLFSKECWVN